MDRTVENLLAVSKRIGELRQVLAAQRKRIEELTQALAAQRKRIRELRQALAAQERADADLRGEADDMAYRFGCLLDHATGGRLSKTNYPKEVMYNAVNEYVQRCCDKAVREAREEWEAEKPTPSPGGGEVRP